MPAGGRSSSARDRSRAERKTALFDIQEKRGRDALTSGVWLRALEAKDAVARELLDEAVGALGVAIGSAVTLLDVEAVVVGGGFGERLGERPGCAASRRRPSGTRSSVTPPEYRLALLGDLGGAIGAALVARASPR